MFSKFIPKIPYLKFLSIQKLETVFKSFKKNEDFLSQSQQKYVFLL